MAQDENHLAVLLEEIRDQNKVVLEVVGDIQKNTVELPTIKNAISELQQDMKVVKAAVTDMSRQQHEHADRILRLETV